MAGIYPKLNEASAPPNPIVFRIEEINRFRDDLTSLRDKRYSLVKRYTKVNNLIVTTISGLGTTFVACGTIGVVLASTDVGLVAAVPLAITAAASGAVGVALQAPKKFYERKKQTHEKISILVSATLDSVLIRISRIIEDGQITEQGFKDLMHDKKSLNDAVASVKKKVKAENVDAEVEVELQRRLSTIMKKRN